MATSQQKWDSKVQVKKGNIGETIVNEYLENRGFVIYKPITEKAHCFDALAIKDKEKLLIVEIKTKARLNKYPATGFDYKHYLEYTEISDKHNADVFIFFVDEMLEKVYGNYLKYLQELTIIKNKTYPFTMNFGNNKVIFFPLDNMVDIKLLTKEQVGEIKKYNTRNYKYKPDLTATPLGSVITDAI